MPNIVQVPTPTFWITMVLDSYGSAAHLCPASSVLTGMQSESDCVCMTPYNSGGLISAGGPLMTVVAATETFCNVLDCIKFFKSYMYILLDPLLENNSALKSPKGLLSRQHAINYYMLHAQLLYIHH